jgi:hypothetical protein
MLLLFKYTTPSNNFAFTSWRKQAIRIINIKVELKHESQAVEFGFRPAILLLLQNDNMDN